MSDVAAGELDLNTFRLVVAMVRGRRSRVERGSSFLSLREHRERPQCGVRMELSEIGPAKSHVARLTFTCMRRMLPASTRRCISNPTRGLLGGSSQKR